MLYRKKAECHNRIIWAPTLIWALEEGHEKVRLKVRPEGWERTCHIRSHCKHTLGGGNDRTCKNSLPWSGKKSQRGWSAVNKENNKVSEGWDTGHERVAALFISTTEATGDHHLENKLENDKNENKGLL